MIARTVHNKVPSQQLLKHAVFTQYEFPQKSVKKSMTVLDIDAIPSYVVSSSQSSQSNQK
jgi:hypothetical protein